MDAEKVGEVKFINIPSTKIIVHKHARQHW